jgi:hypothetical protein
MRDKFSVPVLLVAGAILILGSVSVITNQPPIKISVSKPLSEAAVAKFRIVSPNGGQTFKLGSQIKITIYGCDEANFSLIDKFKKTITHLDSSSGGPKMVLEANGNRTINVSVPFYLAPGSYYLRGVCLGNGPTPPQGVTFPFSDSNGLINIVAPTGSTLQAPMIWNLSPNGGTVYENGTSAYWNASGVYHYTVSLLKKDSLGKYQNVIILPFNTNYLFPYSYGYWPSVQQLPQNSSAKQFSVSDVVPFGQYISSGDYGKPIFKIRVVGFDASGKSMVTAESKEPFTVVKPASSLPTF